MKRELVPLAEKYSAKTPVDGLWVSVKLDGERAVWVPPSRGLVKEDVPFANNPTTWRARDAGHVATGLWTRNGNIIHAPDSFLNRLPPFPIDMELYAGPRSFQLLRSAVSKFEPDEAEWEDVTANIIDAVDIRRFLQPGIIATRQTQILISETAYQWWLQQDCSSVPTGSSFSARYDWLQKQLTGDQVLVPQIQLQRGLRAEQQVDELFNQALADGCEGLILRHGHATYTCARTRELLKYKPYQDAEGTVIGYLWGKMPDSRKSLTGLARGNRLGAMGGIILQLAGGKRFILSGTGFRLDECLLLYEDTATCAADEGLLKPGSVASDRIYNPLFPRGSQLTFIYRSLTNDGLPVEARFSRRRT